MSASATSVRVFRLAEWPAPHPTSPLYMQLFELRRLMASRPGLSWQNMPTVEIPTEASFLKARELSSWVNGLFMALPARLRAELQNDPGRFLKQLRDREFRDRLKADELMYFHGECSEGLIGKPYVKEASG